MSNVPEPEADLPRGLTGGSDVWDQPQASVILAADYFDAAPGGGTPTPLTFADYAWHPYDFTDPSTRTEAGLGIGAAASDRWVIVGIVVNHNTSRSISAVSIGGVSATLLYSAPSLSTDGVTFEFWKANVPTGSTADLSVTAPSGSFWDFAVATYYCTGEPTFYAGQHDAVYTGTTFSVAIDVPEGGAVLAMASNDGAGVLSGWVGATADNTDNTEQVYHASEDLLSAQTGRTVSFTSTVASTGTNFYGMAVLSVSIPMTGGGGQTLTATIYSDGDTFGAASITTGAVGLAPTLFADADSFGAAAVTRGAVSLAPTIYADGDTFGAATVGSGAVTLTATILTDGDTFGSPTVTRGAVTLTPGLYTDADTFGAATVSLGGAAQELTTTTFSDADTFGAATIAVGAVTLTATAYIDPDSFGAAVISNIGGGAQNLTATLFADGDSFGAAVVTGGEPVAPAGSPGGGGTVAKAPDPIRPNRRAQVRDALEDQLDKAQRVDEPVIDAPKPVKKPKLVAPIAPTLTADTTLGIIRDIEARVQAAIDAEATAQALAQAEALAMELAWIAEDEADLELLLLAM